MMLLTVAAAGSTFFAVALITLWALRGAPRPVDARVRALAFAEARPHTRQPFDERVIAPLVRAFGTAVAAALPPAFVRRTERRLVLAGRPLATPAFFALVVGLGGLLAGAYVALAVGAFPRPAVVSLLPAAPLGVLGAFLPVFWLSAKASARQAAILRRLPDSLDLLTLCVQAGLGLEGALRRVAEKQSGPLADELRQLLREIGLGKSRRDALLDFAARTGIDDVRALAGALNQAEQMGTSLASVLQVQSERLRVARRQRAEQEARRAPVKMVFPLVFCLMPSLFIFILGPILIDAVQFLNGR
jgi:tight adherence protein C